MSLRTRIIAWSFVPTAIILLAVALVTFYAYQRVTEELVIGRNRELIRLSASQLVSDLDSYVDVLSTLARTADIYDPAKQAAVLNRFANRLVVLDAGVLVLNPYGRVTATQPDRPELLGQDWSNRSYFRQIVRTRAISFSDIITDGPASEVVVAVAVPVVTDNDEFQGAVIGMFRLGRSGTSALYGAIIKLRIGDNATIYVADSTGHAIYHSNPDLIGRYVQASYLPEHVTTREANSLRAVNQAGEQILASYAPVPGTPWLLVSEESWAGLAASSHSYSQFLLFLLALGVVVPALVVMLGVRRITGPIAKLIVAAKEVAGGQFNQKIAVRTGDELEELVKQFNLMSSQVMKSYMAVKEREERLELVMQGNNDGIWDWNLLTDELYVSPRWKNMLGYDEDEAINSPDAMQRLIHPDDVDKVLAEITAQDSKPFYQIEFRLLHKDGSYRCILARGLALLDANGKPYRVAGSHTDITEQKRGQIALQQAYETLEKRVEERTHELDRRRQVAEALRDILITLNSNRSLDEILDYIVVQAGRLLGCDAIALYELDRKTDLLNIRASQGLDADYVAGMAVPVGKGAAGQAVQKRQPVTLQDSSELLAMLTHSDFSPERWALLERIVRLYRSLFAVPLMTKGDVYGTLALYYRSERVFAEEEINLGVAFANQAALAIENAGLRVRAERTAVAAERDRMARELHDSVTQSIYSVNLYAEAAARLLLDGRNTEAAEHLRELRDTAREALGEMRLLIFELRPLELEKGGLVSALRARLDSVEVRGGAQAELKVEGVQGVHRLTPTVQEELYHIAQEALNNTLKHANARHVDVLLQFQDGSVRLEICDDGLGFIPADDRGGFGLRGMKERAESIGAILHFESEPGKGTKVCVEVPITLAEKAESAPPSNS